MSEYPISLTSSKKHFSLTKSYLKKSACQETNLNEIDPAEYCKVLKGQCIYLAWYINGRQTQNLYTKYVKFMGATLYQRLNPRIAILITNAQGNQLNNIFQRIKKICPQCKVVSSLWLEKCFEKKQRVSVEDFQLERQVHKKVEKENKAGQLCIFDEKQLQSFFGNIGEDIQIDYRQFTKQNKNRIVQYPSKNTVVHEEELFKAKQFDLGPRPNKKRTKILQNDNENKKKLENTRKRKRISYKKQNEKVEEADEIDELFEKELKIQEPVVEDRVEESNQDLSSYHLKPVNVNEMIEKYLKDRSFYESPNEIFQADQNRRSFQRTNQTKDDEERNTYKTVFTTTKQNKSVVTHNPDTKKYKSKIKMQVESKIKPKSQIYKNLQQKALSTDQIKVKVEKLKRLIRFPEKNTLKVVTSSKYQIQKIDHLNKAIKTQRQVSLFHIPYEVYWRFLDGQVPQHQVYFLFNPPRIRDRPQYFALSCKTDNPPTMVSTNLIDQIQKFNYNVRNNPEKVDHENRHRFKYEKKLSFPVDIEKIKGKKIILIKPSLNQELLKMVFNKLEAIWVSELAYFTGGAADIVVGTKKIFPAKLELIMGEDQLWKMIFPIKEGGTQ